MPSEYDNVVTSLETLAVNNLTLGFVKNRLMDIETKMNDIKIGNKEFVSTAFASRPGNKRIKGIQNKTLSKGNESPKFPYKCNYCGKQGHKYNDCRKRIYDNKNSDSKTANAATGSEIKEDLTQGFCFSATTDIDSGQHVRWFLDSGATEHLINSNISLKNARKLDTPVKIRVAKSGAFITAHQVGEIQFLSSIKGKEDTITEMY